MVQNHHPYLEKCKFLSATPGWFNPRILGEGSRNLHVWQAPLGDPKARWLGINISTTDADSDFTLFLFKESHYFFIKERHFSHWPYESYICSGFWRFFHIKTMLGSVTRNSTNREFYAAFHPLNTMNNEIKKIIIKFRDPKCFQKITTFNSNTAR